MSGVLLAGYGLLAFGLSAMLGILLLPLFRRYALQRPNARSSHREPVPQGGGIAILLAAFAIWLALGTPGTVPAAATLACAALMALLGAVDDLRPLSWRLRLAVQALLIAALLAACPAEWRILPDVPLLAERAVALLLGLWFVNLVNFMDGIDGILVTGLAPLCLAIGTGFLGLSAPEPLGLLLGAALLGFLVLNRPPAKVFAGDVGALAIGLLAALLLFRLASAVSLVAAIILPLYFVMDATSTLFARLFRGAHLATAHREHAYQRAFDRGVPALRIIIAVFTLNLLLIGLAAFAIILPGWGAALALMAAFGVTLFFLHRLRHAGAGQ